MERYGKTAGGDCIITSRVNAVGKKLKGGAAGNCPNFLYIHGRLYTACAYTSRWKKSQLTQTDPRDTRHQCTSYFA